MPDDPLGCSEQSRTARFLDAIEAVYREHGLAITFECHDSYPGVMRIEELDEEYVLDLRAAGEGT